MGHLCVLDIQHGLAPGKPDSKGAKAPTGQWERDLTRHYAITAATELLAAGWDVEVWPHRPTTYAERHAEVLRLAGARLGRTVYVACHFDSAPWSYGAAYYDGRSKRGHELAEHLADALGQLPELSSGRAVPSWRAARPGEPTTDDGLHWTSRTQACIAGAWSPADAVEAVTLEPACLGQARHQPLWSTLEGLGRLGVALAKGIRAGG